MKKSLLFAACLFPLFFGGCGKKDASQEAAKAASSAEKREELGSNIFIAANKRDYESAKRMIGQFLELYPGDSQVVQFKLMAADIAYEQERYVEAYEAYNHFQELYPADSHAEYAAYKAAHAKFNQANHVTCDSTPVEKALELCKSYLNRQEYMRYRTNMEDLARTCERNLLDKELYVVNGYLNQKRFASARHRIKDIEQRFDMSRLGRDHLLFCQAKLAKAENNFEELSRIVDDLHIGFENSQFTAMADRLVGGQRREA